MSMTLSGLKAEPTTLTIEDCHDGKWLAKLFAEALHSTVGHEDMFKLQFTAKLVKVNPNTIEDVTNSNIAVRFDFEKGIVTFGFVRYDEHKHMAMIIRKLEKSPKHPNGIDFDKL